MNDKNSIVDPTLIQGTLTILGILLVLTALYGLVLLLSPGLGLRLNRSLSQLFSFRRLSGLLDRQFHVERYFYRHAKIYGLVLLLGAGYLLYRLFFDFPLEGYASVMPNLLPPDIWAWLLYTLQIFLIIMAVFTLFIGLVVTIRPSNIKGLEQRSNRWITPGKQGLMGQRSAALDSAAERAPRLFGGLIFLASIAILFLLL